MNQSSDWLGRWSIVWLVNGVLVNTITTAHLLVMQYCR